MKLYIGNMNYSSWSMRGWLALKKAKIPFEQELISLNAQDLNAQLFALGGAGRVPLVVDKNNTIWDSLSIIEYASEKGKTLWPKAADDRAIARSACAEMHAGFVALRNTMPMNCRASNRRVTIDTDTQADIDRIDTLWCALLERSKGPFLMGEFGAVDIMYAPVASRFDTYNVALSPKAKAYAIRVLDDEDVRAWYDEALQEDEIVPEDEAGE